MKPKTIGPSDFSALFREGRPSFIDVRAPIEFEQGAVPGALNFPLLTNDERHQVGLTYKEQGKEAAIVLGHQIVSGDVRAARTSAWMQQLQTEPQTLIYCFRGGLRSKTVQAWLMEQGLDVPIIVGGYKALRNFFLDAITEYSRSLEFQIIGGPTGSGKTKHLHVSGQPFLDLEALAKHRGSAFGATGEAQPSQADFENALALELIRLSLVATGRGPILMESESRLIGQRAIPDALFARIKESPRMELATSLDERVENIFRDYVLESRLGLSGDVQRFEEFRRSVRAISRKLGGLRTQEILGDLNFAQDEFLRSGDLSPNKSWIRKLLCWYYDPLYSRYRG